MVSIPVDLTVPGSEDLLKLEKSGVKGRYVSIERFQELEDGKTEWRMATSSVSGGNIPTFLAESMIDEKIAHVCILCIAQLLDVICNRLGCSYVFEVVEKAMKGLKLTMSENR